MYYRQRVTALALPVLVAVTLTGCSVLTPPAPAPLTGVAACALGHTWKADLEALSAQVLANLQRSGVAATEVTASGDLSLDWSVEGHVVLTNDFALTITATPAPDQVLTVVQTYAGEATGAAYVNGEVAIPRKWDGSKVKITAVAENNGAAIDPVPFAIPNATFDDSVGLELTCSSGVLTTHPRGGQITQTWSN